MGVTLKYPEYGMATLSVELPWPALNQRIEVIRNQNEYRSPARNLWTTKVGPTFYQITRVFEALTESQVSDLFAFLEGVGFASNKVRYCYSGVEVPCRIIDAPSERVVHIMNRDVSLKFEQYAHPDATTEAA